MSARESVLGAVPFDLTGPLPAGPTTTVLEASAGTGKTYAIVGLLARYVADGPLHQANRASPGHPRTTGPLAHYLASSAPPGHPRAAIRAGAAPGTPSPLR